MNEWFIRLRHKGGEWEELHAPEGRYWADPFLAEKDGEMYLYFEDYDYNKGKLSYMNLEDRVVKPMFEMDTHCSFPSVIQFGDKYYMTPETVMAGELCIYEGWGSEWKKVCKIAGGRFDDPILFHENGYYFVYTNEGGQMVVFRSRNISEGWERIIAEDKPINRSAGHIFWDKRWIRPLQDCTQSYGHSMSMVELDSGTELYRIEPDWRDDLTGCHTFNTLGSYTVLDGRIKKN